MSPSRFLVLSLQGCLNALAELGFPASKKCEPKLSSALDAGPAGLQRKANNTQFAFRVCKLVCSRLISQPVSSQVL